MAFSHVILLTFILATFVSIDAFKLKTREDGARLVPSELQTSPFRRHQTPTEGELDLLTFLELYELEKRRVFPYSGGIFGR